jgi:hypothetical protein
MYFQCKKVFFMPIGQFDNALAEIFQIFLEERLNDRISVQLHWMISM